MPRIFAATKIGGVEGARRALVLSLRAADFEWMWPKCDRADCWVKVKNPAAPAVRRELEEDW
jgi:hypothetical protein